MKTRGYATGSIEDEQRPIQETSVLSTSAWDPVLSRAVLGYKAMLSTKIWVLTPGKAAKSNDQTPSPFEVFVTDRIPNNGKLREFATFRHLYESGETARYDLCGTVSWKFELKSKLTKQAFGDAIQNHPGFDVYFVNPFMTELLWKNVWIQGETYHPGILAYAQDVFQRAGHKIDLERQIHTSQTMAFCNFWVGNRRFWDAFMQFSLPVYDQLVLDQKDPKWDQLLVDRANLQCGFFPYVMERMFTTFLASQTEFKIFAFPFTSGQLLAHHGETQALTIEAMLANERGDSAKAFEFLRRSLERRAVGRALEGASGMDLARELYGRVYRKLRRRTITHDVHPRTEP